MLKRRTTAQFLAALIITVGVAIGPVAPASAQVLGPCEVAKQAQAKSGNITGESSYVCPKNGKPRHQSKSGFSKSSAATTRDLSKPSDASRVAQWLTLCEAHRLAVGDFGDCTVPAKKRSSAKTPKPKPPAESQLRQVAAHLRLPDATPRFGPDPSVNEWNMLAVGYPIWLWTDRPTAITTTAHHDGLTFTLTATWTSTTFTMGDGHTKTCMATTIRPKHVKPATKPSPTCGYTYQTKSKIGHPYTVTANTHWNIDWAANGHHGTFTHTYTGQRTLDIGELQSLING